MPKKLRVGLYIAGAIALLGIASAAVFAPWQWNQFIPDLIVSLTSSIVVGIGVGYALWRFQETAEINAAKRGAESDWRIFRPHVVGATSEPLDPFADPENLSGAYGQLDDVLQAGKGIPIGRWADASPDNEELAAYTELLIEGTRYQSIAEQLDVAIGQALDYTGVDKGLSHYHYGYVTALARGLEPREHVDRFHEQFLRESIPAFEHLKAEVAVYRDQRAKAEAAYIRLQLLLHNR